MSEEEAMWMWYWFDEFEREEKNNENCFERTAKNSMEVFESTGYSVFGSERKKNGLFQCIENTISILELVLKDLQRICAELKALLADEESEDDEERPEESEEYDLCDFDWNDDFQFEYEADTDPFEDLGDYDISQYLVGHEYQFY